MSFGDFGEESFAVMAERSMSDVVSKGNCFNEIFVEPEYSPHGSSYLGDQLYVEDPMGNMIILDKIKDLGFINISRIGKGV